MNFIYSKFYEKKNLIEMKIVNLRKKKIRYV